jgi:hypothetical protein
MAGNRRCWRAFEFSDTTRPFLGATRRLQSAPNRAPWLTYAKAPTAHATGARIFTANPGVRLS